MGRPCRAATKLNVYPKNDSRAVIDSYKPLINSREMLPRIPPIAGCGLRIAVFNYSSALREDLKGSAFVTRFLG